MTKILNQRRFGAFLLRWGLTFLVGLIILVPLYWIFISSITPSESLFQMPIQYFPKKITFDNYVKLFTNLGVLEKTFNTLVISFAALLGTIIFGSLAAYGFTRFKTRGLNIAKAALLFSALIPGIVTARPLYDFLKSMHLLDTLHGLSLLYTSALMPFTVLILTNFVENIPLTIEEAAEIDGASFVQKMFYVLFPLMRPAVATIAIINFIQCLNDLFHPLFFAGKISTLSLGIVTVPQEFTYQVPWDLISTMGWYIVLPIVIFVMIFEKNIMDGIMAGGVKQ